MRSFASFLTALMIAGLSPAAADQKLEVPEELDRAFRDMLEQMKPFMEDAFDFMEGFGGIDDPRHYEMPEVLPNGDIIIRRRPDAPEFVPPGQDSAPDPEDGTIKT